MDPPLPKNEARLRRLAREMGYATFERLPDEPRYAHPVPPSSSYPSPIPQASPTTSYYVHPSQPLAASPQPNRAESWPFAKRWPGSTGDGQWYPASPAHPAYQRSMSSGYPSTRGGRRDSVGSEDTVVAPPSASPLRQRPLTHPIARPGSPLSGLRPSPSIRSPHPRPHPGNQTPSPLSPLTPHSLPLSGPPARPTSPGFFDRPTPNNIPELTPSSPPDWTSHCSVSLPSPGARPKSPATARESLRDILDRQPVVQDDEEVYGDMWGEVVDRQRWRHGLGESQIIYRGGPRADARQVAGRDVRLSEPPKSRPRRSFTLPSQPFAHSPSPAPTPQPSVQPYHPYHHAASAPPPTPRRSFLRTIFPAPPPPSPASPGSPPMHSPTHLPFACPTPPTSPASYPHSPTGLGVSIDDPYRTYGAYGGRSFDVERVYDSLRGAEGRVCFAKLEGVGSPEAEFGEGEGVEETWVEDRDQEDGKVTKAGRRRGFPW
ncbi:hypothetical protein IAT38_000619 [Cryptococcus sp. DSM 104549]